MDDQPRSHGKKRKLQTREQIAKRFAAVEAQTGAPVYADGVHPLNPGFFQLEAVRANANAKRKGQARRIGRGT